MSCFQCNRVCFWSNGTVLRPGPDGGHFLYWSKAWWEAKKVELTLELETSIAHVSLKKSNHITHLLGLHLWY